MQAIMSLGCKVYSFLDKLGTWLPQLGLRFLLAYEFWEAGVEKFNGPNWFTDFAGQFPFPFNVIPPDVSWFLATWTELLGAIALVIGLGTRFATASLIILDLVAWYSVHAENGYNVCNNGYKLPLMYLLMYLPLLLIGPGKASLDHLLAKRFCKTA